MYRIRAGGAIATKRIAEVLETDFDQAEIMKCAAKREKEDFTQIKRAHDSSYDRAFREFNQVIKEYEKKTGLEISSVYLAGGASAFPGIDNHLKSVIEKEVYLSNPFSKVAYPAFMEDTMDQIGPSFNVALGAALRAFE
jgi:Tfp pilus assembly PilM family ATPase